MTNNREKQLTELVTGYLLDDNRVTYLKDIAQNIETHTAETALQANVAKFAIECYAQGINIEKIYCNKTGRSIGTRDVKEIELLFLLNKTTANPAITGELEGSFIEFTNGCSPAWLDTGSDNLNALMKHDPHGYVMYVLGYAARQSFKPKVMRDNKVIDAKTLDNNTSLIINNSLIMGYGMLQKLPLQDVVETAEMLQRFFSVYSPKGAKWPVTLPHKYCTIEGLNDLYYNLEDRLKSIFRKKNIHKRTIDLIQMRAMINKAGGGKDVPSNIAGQGANRGDAISDFLADLMLEVQADAKEKFEAGTASTNHNAVNLQNLIIKSREEAELKVAAIQTAQLATKTTGKLFTRSTKKSFSFTAKKD